MSKKEAKRLEKKRQRSEKKAALVADGSWTNPRKRRGQREFHCEMRDDIEAMAAETSTTTTTDGYRHVAPYMHTFQVHVKARWFGKTLLDLFLSEFGGFDVSYYTQAIETGKITVNGAIATTTTLVRDGDYLEHSMHRHEPRVRSFRASMIEYEDNDMVVVNKPSTIPVHPCGAYRHNSMTFILAIDHQRHPLYPVHRLDRLTSGLLVLAKSPEKAQTMSEQLVDRSMQKFYVAKVAGRFPTPERDAASSVFPVGASRVDSGVVTIADDRLTPYWKVDAPLKRISESENRHGCALDGKASQTLIRVLQASDEFSVIECLPLTGRQHQIRVHLQLLGFPIANDPTYGPSSFLASIPVKRPLPTAPVLHDELCPTCRDGEAASFNWEQLECQGLWLHAYRYKGDTFDVRVALPDWAPVV
ncbi:hypothetical protein SPRG_08331 [Saprolegnia parasitica CBS 223.65]|uniref:Pseudouridine synthase RsuA/RluA-like domain-containing protein n=1 Tax=Saprolegnia parasitica (strain CBS 223.65) TaxID=695850 RepID=A0A067CAS4_SAPPC|nr:hypothetical protein SPRG_08331 [Saprolegnia parasitica CBS 223.65]KDO26255.1 hypothetical protein SPRG_08331 [Saprolegnia parasitica CBS 223.65]|eukprot:XP_012202964.1 hypothetical protein SPRG_08331 [Saprolegnia parasitica CBS 223.65]